MSGFPLRHLRSAFGSILRDARPVEHPELEVSAVRLNLNEQITAASSLLMPRASIVAEYDTVLSQVRIYHQEEAWNTDRAQAHPVLTRGSQGSYVYTFAATYLDADSVAIPTNIVGARVAPIMANGMIATEATCEVVSATVVNVYVFDTGSGTDGRFWLEVL